MHTKCCKVISRQYIVRYLYILNTPLNVISKAMCSRKHLSHFAYLITGTRVQSLSPVSLSTHCATAKARLRMNTQIL